MKITIEIEEDDQKARRLLSCDDAFSLLWNINGKLRGYLKYETKKTEEEIIEEIMEDIADTNLLDLYN